MSAVYRGPRCTQCGRTEQECAFASCCDYCTHTFRASRPTPAAVAECGTDSGYYRHRRVTLTPPCKPCISAHNEAERSRWARRKRAVA